MIWSLGSLYLQQVDWRGCVLRSWQISSRLSAWVTMEYAIETKRV